MQLFFVSGVYWDKGGRANNQDSLILEQVMTGKGSVVLAVVCDGIGGLKEGEIASGFACEKLQKCFYEEVLLLISKCRNRKTITRCLCRCIYDIAEGLRRYGKSMQEELGTTVSLLLIWKNRYLILHLGDSRVYFLKKKKITQLTHDHRRRPNMLIKCLGSFAYQMPDIRYGKAMRRTGFLLCSDGFYHFPDKELLAEICNPEEMESEEIIRKRLKELAVYGLKKGEQDNMTAVYVGCRNGGRH